MPHGGRYPTPDDASQNGRLVCRLRNDANRARRHELAVARLAVAMQADDIDGMLAALPDIDHDYRRRLLEGFKSQGGAA